MGRYDSQCMLESVHSSLEAYLAPVFTTQTNCNFKSKDFQAELKFQLYPSQIGKSVRAYPVPCVVYNPGPVLAWHWAAQWQCTAVTDSHWRSRNTLSRYRVVGPAPPYHGQYQIILLWQSTVVTHWEPGTATVSKKYRNTVRQTDIGIIWFIMHYWFKCIW